jgi:hypothetical protein
MPIGVTVRDEAPPLVATVRCRAGDESMEMVLDDHPAPEMLGQDRRDPSRAGPQEHLLGQTLLDRERSGDLAIGLGQGSPQADLVLVAARVIDGDRGVPGKGGQKVAAARREPALAGPCVHVQRADGAATEEQRRTQHRAEVVMVERLGAVLVGRVVGDLDRPPGKDRPRGDTLAEGQLETDHLGREVGDRDDAQDVALTVPQQHVPAVGAEQRRGIAHDRRQDGVEVERLGHAMGRREQLVELRRPICLIVDQCRPHHPERDDLETRGDQFVALGGGDEEAGDARVIEPVAKPRPRGRGRRIGRDPAITRVRRPPPGVRHVARSERGIVAHPFGSSERQRAHRDRPAGQKSCPDEGVIEGRIKVAPDLLLGRGGDWNVGRGMAHRSGLLVASDPIGLLPGCANHSRSGVGSIVGHAQRCA